VAFETIHVVGAGIAGLAAATAAARQGIRVELYEAAPVAGGRCRSWHDPVLDRTIDNGTHLVIGACRALLGWAASLGGDAPLKPRTAEFPFVDLGDRTRYTLRPNGGWLPWWTLSADRRVPGSTFIEYTKACRSILTQNGSMPAGRILDLESVVGKRLWAPLLTSVMNIDAAAADWQSARAVLLRMILGGAKAWQPWIAERGLGPALIDPALAEIRHRGGNIHFHHRLVGMTTSGRRVERLRFAGDQDIPVGNAAVILALPAAAAARLAELALPAFGHRSIVCAHVRLASGATGLPPGQPFLGVVGGTAHWIAQRGDVLSITASAADSLAQRPAEQIIGAFWADLCRALPADPGQPERYVVIKEKRATIAQTSAAMARRPGPATRFDNLVLAGDWTATGLPATLEGAVVSGQRAVEFALTSKQVG